MKRIFLIFTTVTLMQVSILASYAQTATPTPTPQLTAAQATQIATNFCQAVGASVSGSATAVFPASLRYVQQQDSYFLPRWNIKFTNTNGTQAEVDVVDATGAISRYYNFALSQQQLANTKAAGASLSQEIAIQDATTYLTAAIQPSDISAPTASNMQLTSPATAAGNLWMVKWMRQYGSISYRKQQIVEILQAETGALQALTIYFPSPPPTTGAGSVTQSQAQAAAAAQLQTAGIPNPVLQVAQLMVVQPNTFWQANGTVQPQPNAIGVVAWDCVYRDANGRVDEVWVHSNSGSVIGGEVYSLASGKSRQTSLKSSKDSKFETEK